MQFDSLQTFILRSVLNNRFDRCIDDQIIAFAFITSEFRSRIFFFDFRFSLKNKINSTDEKLGELRLAKVPFWNENSKRISIRSTDYLDFIR